MGLKSSYTVGGLINGSSTIRSVNLEGNELISDRAIDCVLRGLEVNQTVQKLYVGATSITRKTVTRIVKFVIEAKRFRVLSITGLPISDKAGKLLAEYVGASLPDTVDFQKCSIGAASTAMVMAFSKSDITNFLTGGLRLHKKNIDNFVQKIKQTNKVSEEKIFFVHAQLNFFPACFSCTQQG